MFNIFYYCTSLNFDSQLSQLRTIGDYAFCKSGISYIKLPSSLISLGDHVFEGCNQLDSVNFDPNIAITKLPEYTFSSCSRLKNFVLSPAIRTIGIGAFQGCSSMNQLILDYGVRDINENAFNGCINLKEITLPKSIEAIASNAFGKCDAISQITSEKSAAPSAASSAFSDATYANAMLYVPDISDYNTKSPWKRFDNRIFAITENPLIYMVDGEFYGDTIMVNNTIYNDTLMVRVGTTITPYPAPIKEGRTFSGWRNLPSVMPNDTVIVTGAFKYQLNYIDEETKESVYSEYLFYGDSIPDNLYANSKKLEKSGYRYEYIDSTAIREFIYMPANDTIIYVRYIPTETDYTVDGLNYHIYTEGDCPHAELLPNKPAYTKSEIKVPESIEYINRKYPVTVIRTDAFKGCNYLTSISLPDTINSIGTQAFRFCNNLQKIEIPACIKDLGDEIFWGCSKLEEVVFKSDTNIKRLPSNIFQDCTSLESIELPASLTGIANDAFRSCNSLKVIEIPENVTNIGERAFKDCDNLEKVTINNKSSLPDAFDDTFDSNTYENATLYVSTELQDKLNEPWNLFKNVDLGDSTNVEKCDKPKISYRKGVLLFTCETPNAKITSEVRIDDAKRSQESAQTLTQTYVITAYATANGKKRSDIARATMTWISGSTTLTTEGFDKVELQEDHQGSTGTPGDMNGDNKITAEDAALILKQLVGKKVESNNNGE